MKPNSLRARLVLIILTPLLLISFIASIWQFQNATHRANDIFDRGLLSAALAISRDVALSGGDAISATTRSLFRDTSGGELFYHVYAPDGVFVTGYATPPPPLDLTVQTAEPVYYEAIYQGKDVRVMRFQDAASIDGLSGLFTITVWQDMQIRNDFVQDVLIRAIGVIALLVISVGLVVWFGVRLGLAPLLDLQDAIAKRTPNDLDPIRRDVPVEARDLVQTLNSLLDRVSRRISSKDAFISNAAHQLRNPIAGVLALAEAVESAPSPQAAKERSGDLVKAAREATHLTNQLLSFERARGTDGPDSHQPFFIDDLIASTVDRFENEQSTNAVSVDVSLPKHPVQINGDRVMLQEAILNLLNNARVHGGSEISTIDVTCSEKKGFVEIIIQDDGRGIREEQRALAIGRFSQAGTGPGSGLGLPIADQVAQNHGGRTYIGDSPKGARVVMELAQ